MLSIDDSFHHPSADLLIATHELEETINKFGSFYTLLLNKPISCTTFFIMLCEHPSTRTCIQQLCDVNWFDIVEYMAIRYPVLNKSKKIKHEQLPEI